MAEIIDNVKVGAFIKSLLKEKGMTQDQLAAYLNITKAAVSQNLNGKSAFDIQNLVSIAERFHLTLDDLIAARKPKDHHDVDSEYVRMIKRGFADFKTYEPKQLNIAHPDVYGKVFMDYLIKDDLHEWITYVVESSIVFALPEHVRYRPLMQRVILYVLQKDLTSPLPLIQQYVATFGPFEYTERADSQLFFALLNQSKHQPLFKTLLQERHIKKTVKALFFITFRVASVDHWLRLDHVINHVMEFHLKYLWKTIVEVLFNERSFFQLEPYFKRLTQFAFLEGLTMLVESMKKINKIEAFLSQEVMDAMVFLAKKSAIDTVELAIGKNLVYDLNALFLKLIPLKNEALLASFITKSKVSLTAKKLITPLIEHHFYTLVETHHDFFTLDCLSYGLDKLSLDAADKPTLQALIRLGANFQAKYANRFTAEKMNRLLPKAKKGS